MASEEAPGARGGAGVLAPLRLPERVIETLESMAEAARELGPMRAELTRVREQTEPLIELLPAVEQLVKQTEPLAELLPTLTSLKEELTTRLDSLHELIASLEGDESHVNATARRLVDELVAMHKTVGGLQGDVERITDRLPDPEEKRGPLGAARNVLTGSN